MNESSQSPRAASRRVPTLVLVLLPLVLLGGLVWWFIAADPTEALRPDIPPIEQLSIQRVVLEPDQITLHVINDGPDPVTIAQVLVDTAYWNFEIEPSRTLGRLGRATVTITYPWVKDEAHVVTLVTSTGLTFEKETEVAVTSPVAREKPSAMAHIAPSLRPP